MKPMSDRKVKRGYDGWLLFLKLPDDAAQKKPQKKPDVIQLPLVSRNGAWTIGHWRLARRGTGFAASHSQVAETTR